MAEHNFTLTIQGTYSDAVLDALFEAGCDDATISHKGDLLFVEFDREADSLLDAVSRRHRRRRGGRGSGRPARRSRRPRVGLGDRRAPRPHPPVRRPPHQGSAGPRRLPGAGLATPPATRCGGGRRSRRGSRPTRAARRRRAERCPRRHQRCARGPSERPRQQRREAARRRRPAPRRLVASSPHRDGQTLAITGGPPTPRRPAETTPRTVTHLHLPCCAGSSFLRRAHPRSMAACRDVGDARPSSLGSCRRGHRRRRRRRWPSRIATILGTGSGVRNTCPVGSTTWLPDSTERSVRDALASAAPDLAGLPMIVTPKATQPNPLYWSGSAVVDGTFVVKFAWAEAPAIRVWREGVLLQRLTMTDAGLPVPHVVGVSKRPALAITEVVRGDPLSWEWASSRSTAEAQTLGTAIGAFLARLHAVPADGALADLPTFLPAPQAATVHLRARYPRSSTAVAPGRSNGGATGSMNHCHSAPRSPTSSCTATCTATTSSGTTGPFASHRWSTSRRQASKKPSSISGTCPATDGHPSSPSRRSTPTRRELVKSSTSGGCSPGTSGPISVMRSGAPKRTCHYLSAATPQHGSTISRSDCATSASTSDLSPMGGVAGGGRRAR